MEKYEIEELLEGDPAPMATTRKFSMEEFKRRIDRYCRRNGLDNKGRSWNDTLSSLKNKDKK
jgi:aminoglycoside phosphotransferase (APT) family kinase protein